jgi:hypothetical protein
LSQPRNEFAGNVNKINKSFEFDSGVHIQQRNEKMNLTNVSDLMTMRSTISSGAAAKLPKIANTTGEFLTLWNCRRLRELYEEKKQS